MLVLGHLNSQKIKLLLHLWSTTSHAHKSYKWEDQKYLHGQPGVKSTPHVNLTNHSLEKNV